MTPLQKPVEDTKIPPVVAQKILLSHLSTRDSGAWRALDHTNKLVPARHNARSLGGCLSLPY